MCFRNRLGALILLLTITGAAHGGDALYRELRARSAPSDPAKSSLLNPWGEDLRVANPLPPDFSRHILAAAQVYADQNIEFDGYIGSDDDGEHYFCAADGQDNGWFGSSEDKKYYLRRNGKIDDIGERVMVCPDYPVHVLTLAGFPLRQAMIADWRQSSSAYTYNGNWPENQPVNHWYFRRVTNLKRYLQRKQAYWEERISREQYEDPEFRPIEPFRPGDIVLFGHYLDDDTLGPWWAKHSGIVKSVDGRGAPVRIYNMRVATNMIDSYNGAINHTRQIADRQVFFKRFMDRYSLVGHGRIVNSFEPNPPAFGEKEFAPIPPLNSDWRVPPFDLVYGGGQMFREPMARE